jgi:hypothetical protein
MASIFKPGFAEKQAKQADSVREQPRESGASASNRDVGDTECWRRTATVRQALTDQRWEGKCRHDWPSQVQC